MNPSPARVNTRATNGIGHRPDRVMPGLSCAPAALFIYRNSPPTALQGTDPLAEKVGTNSLEKSVRRTRAGRSYL
jgi:hypothetical protein